MSLNYEFSVPDDFVYPNLAMFEGQCRELAPGLTLKEVSTVLAKARLWAAREGSYGSYIAEGERGLITLSSSSSGQLPNLTSQHRGEIRVDAWSVMVAAYADSRDGGPIQQLRQKLNAHWDSLKLEQRREYALDVERKRAEHEVKRAKAVEAFRRKLKE